MQKLLIIILQRAEDVHDIILKSKINKLIE